MMKNFESRKTKRKCNKGFMNKNRYKNCPHATVIFFKSNDLILFHFGSGSNSPGFCYQVWTDATVYDGLPTRVCRFPGRIKSKS